MISLCHFILLSTVYNVNNLRQWWTAKQKSDGFANVSRLNKYRTRVISIWLFRMNRFLWPKSGVRAKFEPEKRQKTALLVINLLHVQRCPITPRLKRQTVLLYTIFCIYMTLSVLVDTRKKYMYICTKIAWNRQKVMCGILGCIKNIFSSSTD